MPRVALLIGNQIAGLPALNRVADLEQLQRTLQLPQGGDSWHVELWRDRPQAQLARDLATALQACTAADQLTLVFSGYGALDAAGQLYLTAADTQVTGNHGGDSTTVGSTSFVPTTAIAARWLKQELDRSPCQQQLLVLDLRILPMAGHIGWVDFNRYLGGEYRTLLTANSQTQPAPIPESCLDVWSYTRYLAEGLETGVTDAAPATQISAKQLYGYLQRKFQRAAPNLLPELYGFEKIVSQPWFAAPERDAALQFRQQLETWSETMEIDPTGLCLLGQINASGQPDRGPIESLRQRLQISQAEAVEIESQVLRPVYEYRERQRVYREGIERLVQQSSQSGLVLPQAQQLQQALGLTDLDTEASNQTLVPVPSGGIAEVGVISAGAPLAYPQELAPVSANAIAAGVPPSLGTTPAGAAPVEAAPVEAAPAAVAPAGLAEIPGANRGVDPVYNPAEFTNPYGLSTETYHFPATSTTSPPTMGVPIETAITLGTVSAPDAAAPGSSGPGSSGSGSSEPQALSPTPVNAASLDSGITPGLATGLGLGAAASGIAAAITGDGDRDRASDTSNPPVTLMDESQFGTFTTATPPSETASEASTILSDRSPNIGEYASTMPTPSIAAPSIPPISGPAVYPLSPGLNPMDSNSDTSVNPSPTTNSSPTPNAQASPTSTATNAGYTQPPQTAVAAGMAPTVIPAVTDTAIAAGVPAGIGAVAYPGVNPALVPTLQQGAIAPGSLPAGMQVTLADTAAGSGAMGQSPTAQAPNVQIPGAQAGYGQAGYGQAGYGQAGYGAGYGQGAGGQIAGGQMPMGQAPTGTAPGQNIPGQNISGQNIPGQNIQVITGRAGTGDGYRSTTGLDLRRRVSTITGPMADHWRGSGNEGTRSNGALANFLLPLLVGTGILGAIWWGATLASGRARGPSWNVGSLFSRNSSLTQADADQYVSWGITKSRQGAVTEAITEYDRALAVNPKDVRALVNRGVAQYRGNKDLGAAYNDYRTAIDLNPPPAQAAIAHSNLSNVLFDQRKYDDALKSAQQATTLDPNLGVAWINLANTYLAKKDFKQAFDAYNTALSKQLDQVQLAGARNNRGNALLAMGSIAAAVEDYNGALKLQPNYAEAYYNRALAFQAEFAKSKSPEHLRVALDDLERAAALFEQRGDKTEAQESRDRKANLSKTSGETSAPATKSSLP